MRESVYLALRTLRGRSGTARYVRGAVAGIALGLVPLVIVMEVSTGMIEGITARLLEIGRIECRLQELALQSKQGGIERVVFRQFALRVVGTPTTGLDHIDLQLRIDESGLVVSIDGLILQATILAVDER